jgi:pimeloyl-ACP methyl ester carboxylesterase
LLTTRFRCITLDLPLGAHLEPLPEEADQSLPALAALIADAIDALELEDVTLVGNDTGGALCQLVAVERPERLGSLVLTSCDAFDNFPPKVMKPLMPVLRQPRALSLLFAPLRIAALRRRMMTAMGATKRPVETAAVDSYALPVLNSAAIRRDAAKLLAAADERYTVEAGRRLSRFERPALIAWSWEDKFFPAKYGERLAATLPRARLEWIDDSYTFSPEDQPDRLAELIASFARESVPGMAASDGDLDGSEVSTAQA